VGVRAPLYFAGGTTGSSFARFAAFDAIGLCLTTPLLVWLGYALGPGAVDWLHVALGHQRLALAAGVTAVVLWSVWQWRRHARRHPPVA
jgi:membrane protein DedA with SNARE-associated domain